MTDQRHEVSHGTKEDEELIKTLTDMLKGIWDALHRTFSFITSVFVCVLILLAFTFWRPSGGSWNQLHFFENYGVQNSEVGETVYLQGQLMHLGHPLFFEDEKNRIGFWVTTTQGSFDYRWFPADKITMHDTSPQPGDLIRIIRPLDRDMLILTITDHAPFDDSLEAQISGYLQRMGIKSPTEPPS
ncbi:TPA: hypothetical protein DEP34_04615 [Candidatus Uhrbacteria bacterium]|uniref:Uncharacterized protein n=2 Tax=Candidatus Uhriibacteriota TaxID=1752732 RepID=A0A0G1T3X5_9BACT|nr:MAG: hypothetical protein UX45_C0037G0004 [Candidatus Uhrbacteria bacterium GW2011_GWF2_46_218]KKU40105.1 MAG: hypothetical protein UX57_C0025G0005 [Candidatus Uhrbacteria bacterium GW2011_GWE2_46_68]HBK34329.1 hypothetical protein [Candidatus Uhrbacteria bacterium]HCB19627.1 hypothetical protein [Candidatus Uhrbacteria bacterium]